MLFYIPAEKQGLEKSVFVIGHLSHTLSQAYCLTVRDMQVSLDPITPNHPDTWEYAEHNELSSIALVTSKREHIATHIDITVCQSLGYSG